MRIGILGSGLMGGKLGTLFARAGHEVVFTYWRRRKKLEELAKDAGGTARAGTPGQATPRARVVSAFGTVPSEVLPCGSPGTSSRLPYSSRSLPTKAKAAPSWRTASIGSGFSSPRPCSSYAPHSQPVVVRSRQRERLHGDEVANAGPAIPVDVHVRAERVSPARIEGFDGNLERNDTRCRRAPGQSRDVPLADCEGCGIGPADVFDAYVHRRTGDVRRTVLECEFSANDHWPRSRSTRMVRVRPPLRSSGLLSLRCCMPVNVDGA